MIIIVFTIIQIFILLIYFLIVWVHPNFYKVSAVYTGWLTTFFMALPLALRIVLAI